MTYDRLHYITCDITIFTADLTRNLAIANRSCSLHSSRLRYNLLDII